MVQKDTVTFWRQLDELREEALSGDQSRANRMINDLVLQCRQGDARIDQGRYDMLVMLAQRFDLEITTELPSPLPEPLSIAKPAPAPAQTLSAEVGSVGDPDLFEGDLAAITPDGEPGISLVTCCMNRAQNLMRALESWLACSDLDEIVIVDWSSDVPVRDVLDQSGIDDPRIRLVRVEGEPRWILSFAFNVGFRVARHAQILKADADIVLDPAFFARNRLSSGEFIAGNWRTAEEGQSHVNGFFLVNKSDLAGISGFNEHITTYGWDDDDLYDRLERFGATRHDVAPGTIYHLPHSDEERTGEGRSTESTRPSARDELTGDMLYKIRANRMIAHIMPYWDAGKTLLPFRYGQTDRGDVRMQRKPWLPHPVPDHIKNDSEYYALLELASWRLGLRILGLERHRLALLLARPLADLGALDVAVALGDHPDSLTADGGYLVLGLGLGGLGTTERTERAFARLASLAERADLGLVLSGPFSQLPPDTPAAAREYPVVPDWDNRGALSPLEVPDLLTLGRTEGRRFLWLDWSEAAITGLNDQPVAPAVAPRRPRLFIDGQHGLGNRLRALASGAAIAQQSGHELVVVWEPDDHCDCRMSDLFDYKGAVIEETFVTEAPRQGCTVYNYMEIEDGAEKNAPIDSGAGDLYLRSAYVFNSPLTSWAAENAFLRGLSPVEAVRDMVHSVRHPNDVSAHVRMAGGAAYEHLPYEALENWTEEGHQAIAFWREKSHFSHFLTRLDALSAEGRADRIFLAADAPETYDAFRAVYGDRLAMLERAVYDRSAEQLRYALADALLLGQAPLILGSTWSSFSELAMRMSPQDMTVEMSGTDF